MKKFPLLTGLALLLAIGAQAQTVVIPPGKLAVYRGGISPNGSANYTISSARQHPCAIDIYDPVTLIQSTPLYSALLPTNGLNSMWINAHAGSEGGAISRSTTRQYLAIGGYHGDINEADGTPSTATNPVFGRGFGLLDAFGNFNMVYSDTSSWFGQPPGVMQNNPTGIATTDGTHFWGTGNVAYNSNVIASSSGTLYYSSSSGESDGGVVQLVQSSLQGAAETRIINGTLYMAAFTSKGALFNGIYNCVDPDSGNAVVPLPWDEQISPVVEHIVQTNLYVNFGSVYANVASFDMDPSNTVLYAADQQYGIIKFVNNAGTWTSPYYYSATNLGTLTLGSFNEPAGSQGCFALCVDFSGANPVIYATTMEEGDKKNTCSNRLIRIVDTGVAPGSALVAQTLATAAGTNQVFRGIEFTPDLRPYVITPPVSASTTNGGSATFTVSASSITNFTYQWQTNGVDLSGQTNSSLAFNNLSTNFSGYGIQCVLSNQYGAVTSAPPAILTVTFVAQPPGITNAAVNLTNFVNNNETFAAIVPTGTQPFTYQWYYGGAPLSDDGLKYSGSSSASLSISNLFTGDSGGYSLYVSNSAGHASNVVDVLTVVYQLPVIGAQPLSTTTLVGQNVSLSVGTTAGTQPFTYQWYQGSTALTDTNEFSGTGTNTLLITGASLADTANYSVVVANGGGSRTSAVASVSVIVPPPPSFVPYFGGLYTQTFDSLPDPGSNSVASINNPQNPGNIAGVFYSLGNPVDFAFPIITNGNVGGLGLSNTMPGWSSAADIFVRFGAQAGDQTAGSLMDFGPDDNSPLIGTNRSLGLLTTSTTGAAEYGVKLINVSTNTLNYLSVSFVGELWHNGTGHRTLSFAYTNDPTATNFVLSSLAVSNATQLSSFSFPTALNVAASDGTQPGNQTNCSAYNVPISPGWAPGAALWLVWGLDYFGSGSGNGYAIDNLKFYASVNPAVVMSQVNYSANGGPTFNWQGASGLTFTVYAATSLNPPNWTTAGTATETPNGNGSSTYSFTDTQSSGKVQQFYKVIGTPGGGN